MYNRDRAYNVNIVAEDQSGNTIRFIEVASYRGEMRGPVAESERERKAISQVRGRMPHLRNVRAEGSIHV